MAKLLVRKIVPEDNLAMAQVIRNVMTEFGAVGSGYSIEDAEVDAMFEAYQGSNACYYVVVLRGEVLGGGGIAPLDGGEPGFCELKKMYFLPEARGKGAGRVLANLLINEASKLGFHTVYVETLQRMVAANKLYLSLGFEPTDGPLGNTGHCGCDTHYIRLLDEPDEIQIG